MKRSLTIWPHYTRLKKLASAMTNAAAFVILIAGMAFGQAPPLDGWVVLPVDDYRALREAAFPSEREPEPPPVEATLTRIDYEMKVNGELATGEARLTIDVIKNGWVRVAIPAGLMVREAQLDGRPVSLVSQPSDKGAASNYLLLSRSGRSVLKLTIVAPVSSTAGTEILRLPVSTSAVSRASVVLPRQGVDLRITGGLLLEKSETADQSRWVAHGRGSEPLTFAWKRRIEDQHTTQTAQAARRDLSAHRPGRRHESTKRRRSA